MNCKAIGEMEVLYVLGIMISPGFFFVHRSISKEGG